MYTVHFKVSERFHIWTNNNSTVALKYITISPHLSNKPQQYISIYFPLFFSLKRVLEQACLFDVLLADLFEKFTQAGCLGYTRHYQDRFHYAKDVNNIKLIFVALVTAYILVLKMVYRRSSQDVIDLCEQSLACHVSWRTLTIVHLISVINSRPIMPRTHYQNLGFTKWFELQTKQLFVNWVILYKLQQNNYRCAFRFIAIANTYIKKNISRQNTVLLQSKFANPYFKT